MEEEIVHRSAKAASGKWGKMYDRFKIFFPIMAGTVQSWGRFDQASIKLKLVDHGELIFTYINDADWCLQTLKNYRNNLGPRRP